MAWALPWQKKRPSYYDLFENHARILFESARLLQRLFNVKLQDKFSPEAVLSISREIKDKEHEADLITHEVIRRISTEFITPIDKEDIRAMAERLDDVVDYIHKASKAFANVYELREATLGANNFSFVILDGASALVKICQLLRNPRQNAAAIRQLCIELHRLENEGDDIKEGVLRGIYQDLHEKRIDPSYYVAWSSIYNLLEVVTDKMEDCANVADQVLTKHS